MSDKKFELDEYGRRIRDDKTVPAYHDECVGNRHGANGNLRVDHESLIAFTKPKGA